VVEDFTNIICIMQQLIWVISFEEDFMSRPSAAEIVNGGHILSNQNEMGNLCRRPHILGISFALKS
jgi:hypothetical protein